MNHHAPRAARLAALVAGALLLSGCRGDREDAPPREFFPDLDTQLKWQPQGQSEMFADGRMMRPVVAGTVPFGRNPAVNTDAWAADWNKARDDFMNNDPLETEGVSGRDAKGDPIYTPLIPASITVDAALLKRGQERFNIYCTACHGYTGDGKGTVAAFYSPAPANFHLPQFKDGKSLQSLDGYVFHTIRYGKPKTDGSGGFTMPGYAHAVSTHDAWAIVAYVRALQASREGSIADVPEAQRTELNNTRAPASKPAAPAGGTP